MTKKLKSEFKCKKVKLYGTCENCFSLHNGLCDYHDVINFKYDWYRNLCPICVYKNEPKKCKTCSDSEKSRKKKKRDRYIF